MEASTAGAQAVQETQQMPHTLGTISDLKRYTSLLSSSIDCFHHRPEPLYTRPGPKSRREAEHASAAGPGALLRCFTFVTFFHCSTGVRVGPDTIVGPEVQWAKQNGHTHKIFTRKYSCSILRRSALQERGLSSVHYDVLNIPVITPRYIGADEFSYVNLQWAPPQPLASPARSQSQF